MGELLYTSLQTFPYYAECAILVEGLGYKLVELNVAKQKNGAHVQAVITSFDAAVNIGIDDCAKVHRAMLARMEALIGTDNISMELASPGVEHNIKNAAEFCAFIGRGTRVWDKTVGSWIEGVIIAADETSVTLKQCTHDTQDVVLKTVLFENIAKAKFIHS